LDKKSKSK